MTAVATVAGLQLFDVLYGWADHAADVESAAGVGWFAGTTQYLVANVTGLLFLPFAVAVGLRLTGVKGGLLAVPVSGLTWLVLTVPHLVDSRPGTGTVILWVTVQVAATAAATVPQTASPRP
ncbi:hypothetical protein [Streptomyces sp. NPDC059651]|uniref:hypothetical protein n=1 Tax=Streptomyces sp. NPDC059651 TaxID=3346897 RepID=UPI00367B819E